MSDRTQDYSTDYVSQNYYNHLVQLRQNANLLLTQVEAEKDPQMQKKFKWFMKLLVREMEPKYMRRTDMDKPEILENKEVEELTHKECEKVLKSICRLQEKLGITAMSTNEYRIDKTGVTDKEKGEKP